MEIKILLVPSSSSHLVGTVMMVLWKLLMEVELGWGEHHILVIPAIVRANQPWRATSASLELGLSTGHLLAE